jgi:hypothetical protein
VPITFKIDCLQLEEGDMTAWELPDELDLTYNAGAPLYKSRELVVDAVNQTATDGSSDV